uniref:EF-hand domain-containing protein n=1 Tax=Romanomermis culicivorax TaxID=13658 RepID=A0A915HX08_ROMCU
MGNCCSKKKKRSLNSLASTYDKTVDELKPYQQAFDQFDKNRDGRITVDELGQIFTFLGYTGLSQEALKNMIASVDRD